MFSRFFIENYSAIKPFIAPTESLLEIGCRDDRGVLSSKMLDFSAMTILDKDLSRINLAKRSVTRMKVSFITADIFSTDIDSIGTFDVVMTTALVHHTPKENMVRLLKIFKRLCNKRIIISGPNKRKQTRLYGDHLYHLDRYELREMAASIGLVETEYLEHDDLAPHD